MGKATAAATVKKAKTAMVDSQIGAVQRCPSALLEAEERLKKHRKNIEAHRKKYADKKATAIRGHRKKRVVGAAQAKMTEAEGEAAATDYMAQHHPEYELVAGFAPGTGFDQVYVRRDAAEKIVEYLIVEAKGPNATLSTESAKGAQMTKEWVKNSALELAASDDPYAKRLGQNVYDAIMDGPPPQVRGKVLAVPERGKAAEEIPCPPPKRGKYNE